MPLPHLRALHPPGPPLRRLRAPHPEGHSMNLDEIFRCSQGAEELVFGVVYDPHFSDTTPKSRKDDYQQALFDKMEFVGQELAANNGQFLILTGDIFHKRALSTKFMCRMVEFLRDFPVPVYGIAGNHDVYAGNVEFLNRTSLGILFASGVIRKLEHLLVHLQDFSVHIRGFDFAPALHVKKPALEDLLESVEEGDPDVISVRHHFAVAHGFIKKTHANFQTKDYVNVPSFSKAGYTALFLGHDHVPYPSEMVDGLLLCRGGNLSRGTKHKYQRIRDVQYHLVTVTSEGLDVAERKIPCAPAEDIYSEEQIEREGLDSQLKKFIHQLQENGPQAKAEDDIFSIIEEMDVPDPTKKLCFRYLQEQGIVRGAA